MSVDSKLFVTCSADDALKIGSAVVSALNKYSGNLTDSYYKESTNASNRAHFLFGAEFREESKLFSTTCNISTHDFETFILNFGTGEHVRRSVYMFTSCGGDYRDTSDEYKVIFSIGYWGKSDEIMKVIAEAVKDYGKVFYDFNDCDSYDFVELFV